jgi:hypothetical protein
MTRVDHATRRRSASHESFLRHRGFLYLKASLLLVTICVGVYVGLEASPVRNGGSPAGYLLGTLAAGLVVWLAFLGVRKRAITRGSWSLKAWTSAHVYLGLAVLLIAFLHSGFQLGWNLHTLALLLLSAVVASGVFGVVVYASIPRKMSDNRGQLSGEQMIEAVHAVDTPLRQAARHLPEGDALLIQAAIEESRILGGPISRLFPNERSCPTARALSYLRRQSLMATPGSLFEDKDDDTSERAARERVTLLLEKRSAMLGRARRHARYKALLEVWLYVHVPLTFALLAALVGHVVSVFYMW